jgi:hypothetical protein
LLKAVYAKLEIPISEVSDRDRTIGNEGLRAHRRLAGMAMQEVLDCGDKMGVLNAEVWDIQVNLQSYVKSGPRRISAVNAAARWVTTRPLPTATGSRASPRAAWRRGSRI